MDILIKNMKMPTEYPLWIVVSADGTVQYNYFNEWKTAEEKAVPVPPHGRLIDADCCNGYFYEHMSDDMMIAAMNAINEMPTIIEAEEGEG